MIRDRTRMGGIAPSLVSRFALALAAVALPLMLSMPWWADSGTIRSVVEFSCYLALAQMWNLLAGYAGLVSVGQQAFVGVAGYALFAAANHFGIDPFAAAGLSLFAPALLALGSYALLRRLDGPYFAIGTWVVAEVCRLIISNSEWLGSSSGMTLRAMQKYAPEVREMGVLWLAALMLLLTVGGTSWLLMRSRHGLALTAMRDDPLAAASQGVDVRRLKLAIYVAAAIGTGLVGAVYYLNTLRLSPNAGFDPNWTSIAIFMVMVGGIGTLEGPLIGAALYFAADRLFSDYGASYMIVLGVLTVTVAVFARGGVWGTVSARFDWHLFPTRRRVNPNVTDSSHMTCDATHEPNQST
jgi:branched-chain amino acid transport system permease protein